MRSRLLLYLLVFLIPVQLGYHFFFGFSQISGIYSDYLIPTIYLTDFIIFCLIFLDVKEGKLKFGKPILVFLIYLVISSLFISDNKWVSIYKLLKTIEFLWLFQIIVRLRIGFKQILPFYSLSVIYTSILAIVQFLLQRSVGGAWYLLGERTFYASTPGIALGKIGGQLFMRPYSTFAHPNIMGGFLALGLPFVFLHLWNARTSGDTLVIRIFYLTVLILGVTALVLSFSRVSWTVFLLGLFFVALTEKTKINEFIVKHKKRYFSIFIILFIFSFVVPLHIAKRNNYSKGSLFERSELILGSFEIISKHPIFGAGLNNSVIEQYKIMPKRHGLFIMQPVHNIYLLVISELGTAGILFVLYFIKKTFEKINTGNIRLFTTFFCLIFLSFFDHYLVTLQQGLLICVLFASLVFLKQK